MSTSPTGEETTEQAPEQRQPEPPPEAAPPETQPQAESPAPEDVAHAQEQARQIEQQATQFVERQGEAGEQAQPEPPEEAPQPAPERPEGAGAGPLVVGIGASAGGMAAIRRFLQAMPPDNGMVFVIIQHLDPSHESLMASLLGHYTSMPVAQAEHGMRIEPDHVYVMPPGKTMTLKDGVLQLREPEERRGLRLPIDAFFKSLGEDQQQRAVVIIMSGTASDGSQGARDAKAQGGLVIAQKPEDAEHDWMPRSAISTGVVDLVLTVEEMPDALLHYQHHPYVSEQEVVVEPAEDEVLTDILNLLNARVGHDFRGYRKSTLLRRIHRRMGFKRIESLDEYRQHLKNDPSEVTALFSDFLIGVTRFFREPAAWEALKERVIRPLLEREQREAIRVWVPACSTGEEVYSLAILFHAVAEELDRPLDLQVFATDIDMDSLSYARSGDYPLEIAEEMPAKYLDQFFIKGANSYRVSKEVRQTVVFAPQNALSDPPFSKMDLISCRNLLIYLEPEVQDRLIRVFHFALRQGGHLFLGASESIGTHRDVFDVVSREHRIYQKLGRSRPDLLDLPTGFRARAVPPTPGERPPPTTSQEQQALVGRLVETMVLEQYAPAAVVIDGRDEVLYYLGRTGEFLTQPRGHPTDHLLSRLPASLSAAARAAIVEARKNGRRSTVVSGLDTPDHRRRVDVHAVPLRTTPQRDLLMVVFQDYPPTEEVAGEPSPADGATCRRLEDELRSTREEMQGIIEELESSNEEMTASSEEVLSMNEELQSANEELETSREELQSLNEELRTLNNELQERVEQVERTSSDLENLLLSSDIATIFLDEGLRLQRVTPAVSRLFNILPGDVGRPVSDLSLALEGMSLVDDTRRVLADLQPIARTVRTPDGRVYVHKLQPYRTLQGVVAGVVITFVDVTELEQTRADVLGEMRKLETIMGVVPTGVVVAEDPECKQITGNPRAYEIFRMPPGSNLSPEEGNRRAFRARFYRQGQELAAADLPLQRAVRERKPVEAFELKLVFDDGPDVFVLGSAAPLMDAAGTVTGAVGAFVDITDRKREERNTRRLAAIVDSSEDAVISVDPEGRVSTINAAAERMYGYAPHEIVGKPYLMMVPPGELQPMQEAIERSRAEERNLVLETERIHRDGSTKFVSVIFSPIRDETGGVTEVAAIERDITVLRQSLEQLRQFNETLEQRVGERTAVAEERAQQLQVLAMDVSEAEQRERRRLARVLHDHLQQLLAAAKLKVNVIGQQAPETARPMVGEAIADLEEAIAETRSLSVELSPPVLQEKGLAAALYALAVSSAKRHDLQVRAELDPAAEPQQETVRTFLYDAARELLFNVSKHSGVKEADLALRDEGDAVILKVSDGGSGFDLAAASQRTDGGFGLFDIQRRAVLLGGRVDIESAPKHGTSIAICMPRLEGAGPACQERAARDEPDA